MNFLLLPATVVAAGAAVLGLALWALQRLRVRHREIEVVSTLFWQAAVKERQARVFVRRFRHWPAWLLFFAIVSLLWMLLAHPLMMPPDGREHVILVDGSKVSSLAGSEIKVATQLADSLPRQSRSILLTGTSISTLLAKGETAEVSNLRWSTSQPNQPDNLHWSLEKIASRANQDRPLTIHLIGHSELDRDLLESFSDSVSVIGVPIATQANDQTPSPDLLTFGYSDSASGNWKEVDVSLVFQSNEPITLDQLSLSLSATGNSPPGNTALDVTTQSSDTPSDASALEQTGDNAFLCPSVPADGQTLSLSYNGTTLAQLSLPERIAISVQVSDDTPDSIVQFLDDSPEFTIVAKDAEVRIGKLSESDFQLSETTSPAFEISANYDEQDTVKLISDLAIDQIDATALATQARQPITLDIVESDKRQISVWKQLLGNQFNFQESRAFPIFLSRSLRWLANRPAEIQSLAKGERNPLASQSPSRVNTGTLKRSDGKVVLANKLSRLSSKQETLSTPGPSTWFRFGPFTWMGILAVTLLTVEWILFQRGKLP